MRRVSFVTAAMAALTAPTAVTAFVPTVSHSAAWNKHSVVVPPFSSIPSSTRHSTTPTRMQMSVDDNKASFSFPTITNPVFAKAWTTFLVTAAYASFREAPEASKAVLDQFLVDPIHPDVNLLFVCIFNLLGLVAIPMACLLLPGSKNQQLPATPFVAGSAFAGFGSLGLYMMTRVLQINVTKSDLGWFTANVLENKIFNWLVVAMACSTFWVTGFLPDLLQGGLQSELDGYVDLVSHTALAAASSLDLLILTLTAASLVPEDLQRRGVTDKNKANIIAASTILLPVVGSVLYCALRPSLAEE